MTDSATPRQYWYDMKTRIQDEGFLELSAKCLQLKMRSLDGKMRSTDAADVETLLRIIQVPARRPRPSGLGRKRRLLSCAILPAYRRAYGNQRLWRRLRAAT
jgi:hypothetical protein